MSIKNIGAMNLKITLLNMNVKHLLRLEVADELFNQTKHLYKKMAKNHDNLDLIKKLKHDVKVSRDKNTSDFGLVQNEFRMVLAQLVSEKSNHKIDVKKLSTNELIKKLHTLN